LWLWLLTGSVVAFFVLKLLGCAATEAAVKQDVRTAQDFVLCDSEALQAARLAPSCVETIDRILEVMQRPECAGFPAHAIDGGISVEGHSFICEEQHDQ
jgi:hypothetical protein